MITQTEYFSLNNYDFSVKKKVDNFLTPYIPCVEAVAIKRKNTTNTYDVYFSEVEDIVEYNQLLATTVQHVDPVYGVYIFSATEDQIEDRFRAWSENVLMNFRRHRND